MNSDTSATLRLFIAIALGFLFIAAGISGRLGTIIASLIDTQDMVDNTVF